MIGQTTIVASVANEAVSIIPYAANRRALSIVWSPATIAVSFAHVGSSASVIISGFSPVSAESPLVAGNTAWLELDYTRHGEWVTAEWYYVWNGDNAANGNVITWAEWQVDSPVPPGPNPMLPQPPKVETVNPAKMHEYLQLMLQFRRQR